MHFLILAAVAGAIALPATTANAQYGGGYGYQGNYRGNYGYQGNYRGDRVAREQRECQRELRNADSRREYYRELRECRREIAEARRDQWRGSRYGNRYRDDYYRDDRRYSDGYSWRDR